MTTVTLKSEQTVRTWGNSLAIRITGAVAKAAHLADGVPVTLELRGSELIVKASGTKPKLSLAQKLARFDPSMYGGDIATSGPVGAEVF